MKRHSSCCNSATKSVDLLAPAKHSEHVPEKVKLPESAEKPVITALRPVAAQRAEETPVELPKPLFEKPALKKVPSRSQSDAAVLQAHVQVFRSEAVAAPNIAVMATLPPPATPLTASAATDIHSAVPSDSSPSVAEVASGKAVESRAEEQPAQHASFGLNKLHSCWNADVLRFFSRCCNSRRKGRADCCHTCACFASSTTDS